MVVFFSRHLALESRRHLKGIHRASALISYSANAIRSASSPQDAFRLYRQMLREGVSSVDSYSALFALKASARLSDPSPVSQIHAHLCKNGLTSHLYVGTALLNCYVYSSLGDAVRLFDEMPERNVVTWNTMVTAYSKSGDIVRAREVFDAMPARELSSWSAVIAGYMDNGKCGQGLALFRQMLSDALLRPDEVSVMTLISGCTQKGVAGLLGKSLHAYVQKNGWPLNVALGTALVDMYAKSGFLQQATQVFNMMNEKNVLTWSAMICGLALHGYGHRALWMFNKMKESNVQPNEITFTGILNACKYAGLVDLGRKNFISMVEDYGLEPRIQHYGCMVDLLGRAGLLDEAYEFIETMKLEPNIIIWSSFLAACKTHGRFDMAERALKPVLSLAKPDRDGGVYTLVSDLYALRSKWKDVEQMREAMLEGNVKKARGSSFIHMTQPPMEGNMTVTVTSSKAYLFGLGPDGRTQMSKNTASPGPKERIPKSPTLKTSKKCRRPKPLFFPADMAVSAAVVRLLLLWVFFRVATPATHPTDVSALRAFKSAVSASSVAPWSCLASWNFSADPCSPSPRTHFTCGITCSPDGAGRLLRVTALVLDPAGYVGPISPALAALSSLLHLDLSDNSFHGSIPLSLFALPRLQTLTLRSNSLSGPLPATISGLKSLQVLDLSRNAFAGAVPGTLKYMTGLRRIDLSFNKLLWGIPKLPPNITELAIKENSLSGPLLQSSFLGLDELEVVELAGNRISGVLGSWFFHLPSLQQIDLSNNSLTGVLDVPDPTPMESQIVAFDMGFNQLAGSIPATLAAFPYLSALSLRYNRLQGTIPPEFAKKRSLRRLFLDGNYLKGLIPDGFTAGGVFGSFGDNCLESCPSSLQLCSGGAQKAASVCKQAYRKKPTPS
ncbi:hypothetical protein H6P81_019484 [Aristolochia fimbriata]|uniref:Pentatricopeptide repeat-containing protein n=1 Tax=Aristolochia fimbriata TaxID=158543 RepID=A0AAV7DSQ5_ARIFI|nr:hypothetical protein H6P81_019484 [Aristolochia fimbriata]